MVGRDRIVTGEVFALGLLSLAILAWLGVMSTCASTPRDALVRIRGK